jgi:hypothetical protein
MNISEFMIFSEENNEEDFFSKKNDAEMETRNFCFRMGRGYPRPESKQFMKKYGAFRWKGVFQNKDYLVEKIKQKNVVDLGGSAGPINNNVCIVDINEPINHKGKYFSDLNDIDFKIDFLFSSHCLEHIPDLEREIIKIKNKMKKGAEAFFNLPAYTCTRWLPKNHRNRKYNDHKWSFCIYDKELNEDKSHINIRKLIEKYFKIIKCEYCGDDSIIIICKN